MQHGKEKHPSSSARKHFIQWAIIFIPRKEVMYQIWDKQQLMVDCTIIFPQRISTDIIDCHSKVYKNSNPCIINPEPLLCRILCLWCDNFYCTLGVVPRSLSSCCSPGQKSGMLHRNAFRRTPPLPRGRFNGITGPAYQQLEESRITDQDTIPCHG